MNSEHADSVADLCEIPNADSLYYGIYEMFSNGKMSCVGIMQHHCTAKLYERILLDQYEYCEIIDRPKIVIKQIDTEKVVKLMVEELKGE